MRTTSGIKQRIIELDIESPDIQSIIQECKVQEQHNRLDTQLKEIRQSVEGIDRSKKIIEKAEINIEEKFNILQQATNSALMERERFYLERKQKKLNEWKQLTGRI